MTLENCVTCVWTNMKQDRILGAYTLEEKHLTYSNITWIYRNIMNCDKDP